MADKINDGGPAFPATHVVSMHGEIVNAGVGGGMSLRDWFAGMAMQAIVGTFRQNLRGKDESMNEEDSDRISFDRSFAFNWDIKTGNTDGANEIASDAYIIADAMLKAREAANGNH